ncbi:MAG TPA: hypothetical protein VNU95_10810 [Candidatus Acidoferrales bacterium]|jgi:hypothetical protein|nr:hypothetical protein [Candidatus Acidoferrales bacterium]
MSSRVKKVILLVVAVALLVACGQLQKSLNHDRAALGMTISEPLQDAPPLLALTTQALGGFRGLISNFLWMRANDLQINDQFFEAAQLANWITDLEPHFTQVWVYEGWNMAYNISVKFKDPNDRWRWVQNGITLLRDRGLLYNPNDLLIYRELAWFYQHKMGQNLDDANLYYKTQWAEEMTPFFGPHGTNFDALINPQTAEQRTNAIVLFQKYKIDPAFAKKVDDEWGPLDWRLPDSHAIYWAAMGLEKAKEYPEKVTPTDLITLRRVIYQSMLQSFDHGRVIDNPFIGRIELGPNFALAQKVNDAYETEMKEDPKDAEHISIGHRNFLADAAYYMYEENRMADAQKWYNYLGKQYPDKTILDKVPDSYPRNLTLDEFAVGRVQEDAGDTSQDATTALVESLLVQAYENLAIGQDDRYTGLSLLAHKVYAIYEAKAGKYTTANSNDIGRTGLPPFKNINNLVLANLLSPQQGLPYAARAVISSQLGITNVVAPDALPSPTNAPEMSAPETNAPAQ